MQTYVPMHAYVDDTEIESTPRVQILDKVLCFYFVKRHEPICSLFSYG